MSETVWLPGLVVLAVGLAVGLAAAVRLRRGRRRGRPEPDLRLRDLEAQRDELFRRLRDEELEAGDRESLELRAARTLRELDRLAPARGERAPAPAAPAASPAASPAAPTARRTALVGFVAGLAVALGIGALVYLAVRDSGARQEPAAAASPDDPHSDAGALPAEVRSELERLEAAAAAAPQDFVAFKRLALARLDAGLYVEAFRDAERILADVPEDPDGLFIQGVVRLSMGQSEEAVELLDRVLANFPQHLQAMVFRGLALAQGGDVEQAVDTWELALEMAGGSHPEIESLLAQAASLARQPPAPPAAAEDAAPPPAAAPSTAPSGPAYRVAVELAPGRRAEPGAVLFVFLRPGEAAPPVAVRRVASPRFPLEVALTAGDAMMGAELPAEGLLVARLDADGSASSQGPDDLEASAPATLGQPLRLVLGGS